MPPWDHIEARAAEVAERYGFDPELDDVRDLVAHIGGRIHVLTSPDQRQLEGGSLTVAGEGDFDLYLSPTTGRLRDNFTIAHELGHYFLHTGERAGTVPGTFGRYGDTPEERQANRFAAALLMPKDRFLELARHYGDDKVALANCFTVSPRAAEVRLQSLRRR